MENKKICADEYAHYRDMIRILGPDNIKLAEKRYKECFAKECYKIDHKYKCCISYTFFGLDLFGTCKNAPYWECKRGFKK